MAELIDLAVTAAGNTARFPENMQFRAVNDAARELEAMIARELRDRNMSIAASGSSNAFAITTSQTITSYTDNLLVGFTANHTITGAATLAVNGMPAKSITAQDGSALGRNDIVSGQKVLVVYKTSSGAFQIVGGRVAGSSADILARIVKAGMVMAWPIGTAPTGWLECNGAAISRTTYAELFAAIGTTYGVGDGSTTFNLPDYRGEFLRGFANGSSNDPDRTTRTNRGDGATGDAVGTKQSGETEAHTHAASLTVAATGSTSMAPDHVHSYGIPATSVFYGAGGSGTVWSSSTTPTTSGPAGAHTHTVSVTGTAAGTTNPSIGDETRPRNIAVMWIILANPAAASAAALGLAGFAYSFDTGTTDADPGTGKLRFNNATISSVSGIYLSETDGYNAILAAPIQALPVNTSLYIYKVGDPSTYAFFTMGAMATDGGTYDKLLSLTYGGSNGTFANGDSLAVIPFRAGATGATGPQGADGGIRWLFSSTATMADPGSGNLRLNNATLANVTEIALSANNGESGNPDCSDWVSTWDDSTTTGNRGQIIIRKASATQNYAIYNITSNITDNTTWLTATVAHVASNGSFSATDQILVSFHRSGDKGLDGSGSGTVTSITAGGGLSSTGVGSAGGSLTVSGTLTAVEPVNAQTGTTYTFVTGDNAKLVTFSNASSVAVTLPQATSTFGAGWHCDVVNLGAGVVTITPTTSTIDGATTLVLKTKAGARIVSDGTNYLVTRAKLPASGASAGSYTNASVTVDEEGRITSVSSGGAAGGAPTPPQGRLTISTGVPVMTSTVSGATTVYYSPYIGTYVPLYDGSSTWSMADIGGELSQATTDSTKSPAACATNSNYDLFVWDDGGTYRCTRGPLWSSSTARGTGAGTTELELVDGVWVNKVAITNGPGAKRGTYVGTIRTNSSSQVDYILGGTSAGGTAAVIGVWNMYNRVMVFPNVRDSTSSWTYNSTTIRAMNASNNNRISFVRGLNEDGVSAVLSMPFTGGTSGDYQPGIALDATSAMDVAQYGALGTFVSASAVAYSGVPGIGWHYLQAVEKQSVTASAASVYGTGGGQQLHSFVATLRA